MNPPNSSQQEQQPIFPKCTIFLFLPILFTLLILFYLQSIIPITPLSFSQSPPLPHFLPLKDLRFSQNPAANNTWFMSSLPDNPSSVGQPSYLHLPSPSSSNRLLCLSASDTHDGARNSYSLAFPQSLPPNSTFLPGLTFVSETFYDYHNLWHGLAAILPFASWHADAAHGCAAPERWLLFHWGEVREGMGMWVEALAEVSTGAKVRVVEGGEACFEEAVVMRRGDEGMSGGRKEEVYDMMRCRGREYCGLGRKEEGLGGIRMTLFFRVGFRAFRNEKVVKGVFERECGRVEGCMVRVVWAGNLTFCDQVWAS